MTRVPVQSSNLASIGYDPASKTLEVEFKSGGVHQFLDVPAQHHEALMNAKSHGSHFHAKILNRFKSQKVG